MTKLTRCLMVIALLLLFGCAKPAVALPAPAELYSIMSTAVTLPEMVEFPQDEIAWYLGIDATEYTGAVVYSNINELQPDEIIIVEAVSEDAAASIYQKLESHLAYKEKSAANYLPQNVPVLQKAALRQDGLTVSLLISEQVDELVKVFNNY